MKNYYFFFLFALMISFKCMSQQKINDNNSYKIKKTDAEWKNQLPKVSYYVLRQSGTEYAFTGKYDNHYKEGVYKCMGCGADLYSSENKYNSRCGWPSFDRGENDNLEYSIDYSLGMIRTEIKCKNCGGHLGHLFNDGPKNTTGKRHCINSAALNFDPKNE